MTQLKPSSDRPKILKQKHDMICKEYLLLTKEYPEASPHRIFDTIADRHEMTIPGVRNVVIKAGLYKAKRNSNR